MALVAFLRGVNVGGHRRFRPSVLAKELEAYGVVNVGAAGTLVVRNPGPHGKFRAELLRRLPFQAVVAFCSARDVLHLETNNPFAARPSRPDIVRFVSILSRAGRCQASLPCVFPPKGPWLVRVIAWDKCFVFGEYRRSMKTIGHLGRIDQLFGAPVTTRNWNTIVAIARILREGSNPKE